VHRAVGRAEQDAVILVEMRLKETLISMAMTERQVFCSYDALLITAAVARGSRPFRRKMPIGLRESSKTAEVLAPKS